MATTLMLTGDVNLMNVTDPQVPFVRVKDYLARADVRFANLECCFYEAPGKRSRTDEGFYASPASVSALRVAGFNAVGTANNVNYGAEAIVSSVRALDGAGIAHTGSGANSAAAHEPAIVQAKGARVGFLQRTSVFWPTNHEAGENSPGVAAMRGETAYRVPAHRGLPTDIGPINRPGVPPEVVTWADETYLGRLRQDIKSLRERADIVVASHHWGLKQDVLRYMTEIAHAAIDAGADVVIGHGPHYSLPIEIYRGKPIFYGLGSFSFHTGHHGMHGDWVGELARVVIDNGRTTEAAFRMVRHNDANETYVCDPSREAAALEEIESRSKPFGTKLTISGDEVVIGL